MGDQSSKIAVDQSALRTVLIRNNYFQVGYGKMLIVVFVTIILNILLAAAVIYKFTHPVQPVYIAATADGRIVKVHKLSEPVVDDSFVLQWSVDAVRSAFSLDFKHWRAQLSQAQGRFTTYGWDKFVSSLRQSNNLNTLIEKKLVSNITVTGSPQITRQQLAGNQYVWQVEMPILLEFVGYRFDLKMPMNVTLLITRVPVSRFPQRIAINNFIADTVGSQIGGG